MPALGHEDVRRLNVPVHDSFCVRRVQRVRNLDRERQHNLQIHDPPGNAVLERHPVQKLHGNEGSPFVLANVIDRGDIRVIQRGCGLGSR
jgi:hypothetical protein